MMRDVRLPAFLIVFFFSPQLRAEEGMWIPLLVEKYQIGAMKEAGLRIEAEEIYSINQDCLKDAIVIFGRGCTGGMVSGEGLVLTNHHCGEGEIQSHSSVENDYLTHGFWAMDRTRELPNPGLSVTFLRYMEEVTDRVVRGVVPGMETEDRERRLRLNQGELIREATRGTHYHAEVESFYYGNAYYLFVYERFRDVRLVGAPPESIGNFGADLDNWVWPRHTGDFSLFRVYADSANHPADYDPSNVAYRPRMHFRINAGGICEGDFTMILGYPANTTLYLHSDAVRSLVERWLPLRIGLRSARLDIMARYMKESDRVRIQYTHKYSRVSNEWKKWQGVIPGLDRNHVVERKLEEEQRFIQWIEGDGELQMKYDDLPGQFEVLYADMGPYTLAREMMDEAVRAVELFLQGERLMGSMKMGLPSDRISRQMEGFFRDFHLPVDRDIFAVMMKRYAREMPAELHPAFFSKISGSYRSDYERFAEDTYHQTLLGDPERCRKLLEEYGRDLRKAIGILEKDPMVSYMNQFRELYDTRIIPAYSVLAEKEQELYRRYLAGLLEMSDGRMHYPDANGTMRLTYGVVEGYEPVDGVKYLYATTLGGVMEKNMEGHPDYRVPERLVDLFERKEFGEYGVNGTMPVCFTASNHTSGGNSGSPVLDAWGRLIGLNFDRDWEGTMSDLYYDSSLCRNIAVDIRYVLFIIDKYAQAGYLLEEMDIVR